jgi:hypothetical protein
MKIKIKKSLVFVYAISLLLNFVVIRPTQACACGMLVAENSKSIEMKSEQGLVVFNSKAEKEQLAINFQLEGTSNKSALVVPTPVKAEINQIKKEVFDDLDYLVSPPLKTAPMVGALPDSENVEVLERKTVGNFEIAALKANSYQDLYAWTEENNFKLAKEAENPIRSFIESGFVLNVIKLKKGADKSDINPLLFEFKTKKIFYPLMEVKDSRDDQKDKSLDLYILSDIKTSFVNFASIGNRTIDEEELSDNITRTDDKDLKTWIFLVSNTLHSLILIIMPEKLV